jgi:hypothetical protein
LIPPGQPVSTPRVFVYRRGAFAEDAPAPTDGAPTGEKTMKTQTLASAFQTALTRTAPIAAPVSAPSRDGLLLQALQRSVTARDQIVQRRIGLQPTIDFRS